MAMLAKAEKFKLFGSGGYLACIFAACGPLWRSSESLWGISSGAKGGAATKGVATGCNLKLELDSTQLNSTDRPRVGVSDLDHSTTKVLTGRVYSSS